MQTRKSLWPLNIAVKRRQFSLFRQTVCFLACVWVLSHSSQAMDLRKPNQLQPQAVLKSPEDRKLSPLTGYNRGHWLEITEKLLAGVLPCFNTPSGMPKFKGVPEETGHFKLYQPVSPIDPLERIMMLSIVYTAATGKDTVPGYSGSITAPFLKAITLGTDPQSAFYWRSIRKSMGGDGSVIAMGVLLSPRFFWAPLTPRQKQNLLVFLQDLAHAPSYDCNHWYFHMMAVPLLEKNGLPSNRQFLTTMFERLLNWHRGDGWFIDGGNRGFDYYNFWGFQLFNQALYWSDEPWRKRFGERVNQTTARFLETLPFLFGRDGGPVPYGRSLAYRFASIAAIGWAALNHASILPSGEARRIASGCLKYFWEQGCLSENGLLEVGFLGPNSVVGEPYMGHGVTYWAAQGLVPLLIPATDPFWTAVEKPMPADGNGGTIALPGAQMVVRVSPIDGEVRLYPVGQPFAHWGQWQRGIKYCQHAYSSYLGWCATGEGGPDLGAGRTGVSPDGVHWSFRERPRAIQVSPDHLISTCEIGEEDGNWDNTGELITHTLIGERGEVHVFWHSSPKPVYLYLGGYGLSVPHRESLRQQKQQERLLISGGSNHSLMKILEAPPGQLAAELLEPRRGWSHSHLFGGRGAFPHWQSSSPVPPHVPVVIYVDGARDRNLVEPSLSIHWEGNLIGIQIGGKTCQISIPGLY
jgi:hypothetical protein